MDIFDQMTSQAPSPAQPAAASQATGDIFDKLATAPPGKQPDIFDRLTQSQPAPSAPQGNSLTNLGEAAVGSAINPLARFGARLYGGFDAATNALGWTQNTRSPQDYNNAFNPQTNPNYNPVFPQANQQNVTGKIGNAVGGMAQMATGGPILAGVAGAEHGIENVEAHDINASQTGGQQLGAGDIFTQVAGQGALNALLAGIGPGGKATKALLGTSERAGLLPSLSNVIADQVKNVVVNAVAGSVENTVNQVVSNAINKGTTNPEQDLTEGAKEAALIGGAGGTIVGGAHEAIKSATGASSYRPPILTEEKVAALEQAAKGLKEYPQNAQQGTSAAPGSTEGQGGAASTLAKAPNALPASLEGYTPQVRIPGTAENNAVPLSFADPKEMAAYVVATGREGKRAADARQWLQGQGLDDDAVNDLARKSRLRAQRAAEQGFSTLPTQTPDINEANRIAPKDYTPQHQNISDISEAFRGRKPNLYDADDKMAGYVSPDGETWLNVRNIRSPKDLMDTVGHEAMHGYQQDYPDLTDQWWQKTPKDIQDQEADRYQQKWRSIPGQENWTHPNDVERQAEAQATLAGRLASDPKIADRIFRQDPGFIRRFVEWIQDRFGPNKMPPEVRAYVQTMREALARNQGEGTIEPGAGTRPEVNQAKPSERKAVDFYREFEKKTPFAKAYTSLSPTDVKLYASETPSGLRGLNDPATGKQYWWKADTATHDEARKSLGIPEGTPDNRIWIAAHNGQVKFSDDYGTHDVTDTENPFHNVIKDMTPLSPKELSALTDQQVQAKKPSLAFKPAQAPFTPEPNEDVRDMAKDYAGENYEPHTGYVLNDKALQTRIAQAYETAPHNPEDPAVAKSYAALKEETAAQYEHAKQNGYTFTGTGEENPYRTAAEMRADVADNKHLSYYQGGDMPADHPLAEPYPGEKGATYNDIFRAVHDLYGHAKEGYGFGPRGEENAWLTHRDMYSAEAQPAMTSETRGQNSWVNYGPEGQANRTNPANTTYAEQKAALLPAEFNEPAAVGKNPREPAPLPTAQATPAVVQKFTDEDIKPKWEAATKGLGDSFTTLRNFLGLQGMGGAGQEGATIAKNLFRFRGAELANRYDRMHAALADVRDTMNKTMDTPAMRSFVDNMEAGAKQATPELDRVATVMRGILDDRAAELSKRGFLGNYIQNYFPHMWSDYNKAESFYAKTPLEGDKGFLKARTLPTQADGIAAGLTPTFENPIEAVMHRVYSMDKFLTAREAFEGLEKDGLLRQMNARDPVSEGYQRIDDKISRIYAPPSRRGAVQEWQRFDAPEAVASVINNYTDPGFIGKPGAFPLRAAMGIGNTMNMVQLGLSGFHASMTAGNSVISSVANGMRDIRAGDVGQGLKSIAQAPIAPIRDFLTGGKIQKEWANPGSTDAQTAQLVQLLKQGGGRANKDLKYDNGFYRAFKTAFDTGNYIGAALRAPAAVLEKSADPIMKYLVPKLKLGAFAEDVQRSVRDAPNGAGANDIASAAGKSWDSIDNRFGQLVYDNVFWNKALKQGLQLTSRSVGWNLGTLRELGGGVADLARGSGTVKPLSSRAAYTLALPAVTALTGGLISRLVYNQDPQDAKDLFYPRTGEKDKQGRDVRIALPTYMKDVYAYGTHPVQTVEHKASPLINSMLEVMKNEDFYGHQIVDPRASLADELTQAGKYAATNLTPFSTRLGNPLQHPGQYLGFIQAPADIERSDAETEAQNRTRHWDQGPITEADAQRFAAKSDLRERIASLPPSQRRAAAIEGVHTGVIDARGITDMLQQAALPSLLERQVAHFTKQGEAGMENALAVYQKGTPDEKAKVRAIILQHLNTERSMTPTQKQAVRAKLNAAQP